MTYQFSQQKHAPSYLPPPSKKVRFGIELGDSVVALGMRRTGKTRLSKLIYQDLMNAHPEATGYVLDTNAVGDFSGWSGGYSGTNCPIIRPGPKGRQVVWQPERDSNQNAIEDFFGRLYQARIPAVVFIDELSALGGGEGHDNYATLLKRGRKRDSFPGVTVISVTQELAQKAKVPRQTFSQMVHFFRFYIQHPYDTQEANKLMHLPTHVQPEHTHGFWHAVMDRPPLKPTYHSGMEKVFT